MLVMWPKSYVMLDTLRLVTAERKTKCRQVVSLLDLRCN